MLPALPDLIYVGGGSVISMLGVWRPRQNRILRGTGSAASIPSRDSAGSLWFEECDHLPEGNQVTIGLGLLPWSNQVHFELGSTAHKAFEGKS